MESSLSRTESVFLSPDQIPDGDGGCVVWHCRQLRTTDHPVLAYAEREYDRVLPIFIFDPSFYGEDGLACDARIRFLHESLEDLSDQYAGRNGELTLAHGDPITVLQSLADAGWDIATTADPTGRYGLRRDNAAAEACDVTFIDADGLVRDTENSRENWSDKVEAWLTDETFTWDETAVALDYIETPVSIDTIEARYSVDPNKTIERRGGTTAAWAVVESFADSLSEYPGSISAPTDARTGTSQLSPYLRFGCLSVREVYQSINEDCRDGRAKQMFVSRLYWNKHYNQKLADWPGWMDTAVNPVLEAFHADTHNSELVEAWKHGQTGYPMVDASMRCLKQTGWLNFRMRAMCASFLCDLMQQPWKIGADWFYYHLLDADPAINYTQFQIQAGVDGTNMMRIYNPRKQVTDNDPDGEFVTKWVPELAELPVEYLDRPEKTPVHVQNDCGISIGDDYPYPIVEYEAARKRILDKFEAVKPEAKRALQNPEVVRRASLSQSGGVEDTEAKTTRENPSEDSGTEQSSLAQFD
jgi:deoxyribodipyrimidine photo-lyase